MNETFPELLNRIALAHIERKTAAYIRGLEAVVKAAHLVAGDRNFDCVGGSEELKSALSNLSKLENVA